VGCAAGSSMNRTPIMEPNYEKTTTKIEFVFSDKKITQNSTSPPIHPALT
jgi:hypothetical protein